MSPTRKKLTFESFFLTSGEEGDSMQHHLGCKKWQKHGANLTWNGLYLLALLKHVPVMSGMSGTFHFHWYLACNITADKPGWHYRTEPFRYITWPSFQCQGQGLEQPLDRIQYGCLCEAAGLQYEAGCISWLQRKDIMDSIIGVRAAKMHLLISLSLSYQKKARQAVRFVMKQDGLVISFYCKLRYQTLVLQPKKTKVQRIHYQCHIKRRIGGALSDNPSFVGQPILLFTWQRLWS